MTNHWGITIGINQYRHLQPLMHAQNDALFTHRFLVEEANFPLDHCVLLSDLAISVGHQVVYPDKPALSEWIQTITQRVEAADVLWVFFSGYGVQLESEDFLMPIDGDPEQIASTGLAMSTVMKSLAQLPTHKVLLLLDMNRAQGSLAGQAISQQVIELAKEHGIPTLLSCRPEQYSHETFGTRHGLFTATLLEALQQQCTTIGQISDYLDRRLPEICEHHWRPIQNLVSVVDDKQRAIVVLPTANAIADVAAKSPAEAVLQPVEQPVSEPVPSLPVGCNTEDGAVASKSVNEEAAPLPPLLIQPPDAQETAAPTSGNHSTGDQNGSTPASAPAASAAEENDASWRNWGLLALALLVVAGVLNRAYIASTWQGLSEWLSTPTADITPAPASDRPGDEETPDTAETEPVAGSANSVDESEAATPPSSDSSDAADTVPTTAAERASVLIAQANAAIAERQFSEALIALQQVPQSQRDSAFSSVLTQARAGAAEAQQANASVLTEARTAIQPLQAFKFTEAIAQARLIKPGEPYYEAAQEDIRTWSQIILDIAEGRATSGDLNSAIAAATIMPYDNAELYQKAQERIVFWQQRQGSREIIAQAQAIPVSGQASSYQQGIVKLQEVPIEHPEYETAQRLADDWSERIFSIAQARAAQGRQQAAVQAAVLVPAGTAAYEPAQQAIRRWQAEP